MNGLWQFLVLSMRTRARRVVGLAAFASVFILAAVVARLLTRSEHGHVEMEPLFELGGTTLVSALLLLGWLIGRFGIIAVLVLMSGVFSEDRSAGYARLHAVRPGSLVLRYAARACALALIAFALSAVLLPVFDYIMLGTWPDATIFVLIAAHILVFGSLTALLSTATRADAWVALFLAAAGLIWDALRRIDFFDGAAHAVTATVSVLLPPQGALMRIEAAFAAQQPVPWDAFGYVVIWSALASLLAGVVLARREL